MSIENYRQYENTKSKLRELEKLREMKRQQTGNDHVRELTLRSLMKRINQFKEELARFEAHSSSAATDN